MTPPAAALKPSAPATASRGAGIAGALARDLVLVRILLEKYRPGVDRVRAMMADSAAFAARFALTQTELDAIQALLDGFDDLSAGHAAERAELDAAMALATPGERSLAVLGVAARPLVVAAEGWIARLAPWRDAEGEKALIHVAFGGVFDVPAQPYDDVELPGSEEAPLAGASATVPRQVLKRTASSGPLVRDGLPTGPVDQAQSAFDAMQRVVDETRDVYGYTAERIAIVEAGLTLYRAPRRDPALLPASTPAQVADIAGALATLYAERPPALRRSEMAAIKTTECRRALFSTEQAIAHLRRLPATQALREARAVNVGLLRGKAIPLLGFPKHFAQDPILQTLFPPV